MSEQQEKMKALKQTIERLEKTYGKGVVMKMDDTRSVVVDVISTGSFGLDCHKLIYAKIRQFF